MNNFGTDKGSIVTGSRRIIVVPLTDSDGIKNKFANIAAVTKAAMQAKFDAVALKDRFYPVREYSNAEMKSDNVKVEKDDFDIDYFIRHGVETFTCKLFKADFLYLKKLSALNFVDGYGFFSIDTQGNLEYLTDSTETEVKPIPFRSWYIDAEKPNASKVYKGLLTFKVDLQGADKYRIRAISSSKLDFDGLSEFDVYSLEDAKLTVVTPTTGGATVKALIDNNPDYPILGLEKADFTLTDDAQGAETITTVTDNGDGTYSFTWTLGADGYILTATKSRYEFTPVTFTVAS